MVDCPWDIGFHHIGGGGYVAPLDVYLIMAFFLERAKNPKPVLAFLMADMYRARAMPFRTAVKPSQKWHKNPPKGSELGRNAKYTPLLQLSPSSKA